jgi:DNA-directed RNA polymerase specialized sigma subunit
MERVTKTFYDDKQQEWITKDYIEQKQGKNLKPGYWFSYPELFRVYSKLNGKEPMVLSYIILNANKLNQLKITHKQLSKKLGISERYIRQIMKKLKDLNIIYNANGTIYLNPTIINKGKSNAQTLVIEYMPMFKKELQ